MHRKQAKVSIGNNVILLLVLINAIVLQQGMVSHPGWYRLLPISLPLLLIALLIGRKL